MVNAKSDSLGNAVFDTNAITIGKAADAAADAGKTIKYSGLSIGGGSLAANVKIDDVEITATGVGDDDQKAMVNAVAAAINAKIGETGVYAEVDGAAGKINLTSVKESVDKDGAFKAMTATAGTSTGVVGYASVAIAAGSGATATAPAGTMLNALKVDSVKGAQQALEIVDKALGSINSTRADLGAIQNRFTSVVANLQTSTENLSASRSRIKDTDFAKETAELTRTQILQQAGTAMLAQANQVPQNVLSLLR